jgi:hypothetical protein
MIIRLLIAILLLASTAHAEPFNRAKDFGPGWTWHNGKNTRQELLDEGVTVAGLHLCPYTLKLLPGSKMQVDHVIPEKWAWLHGAEEWTYQQRVAFANDKALLLLVDGPTNEAKGDRGVDEWLPEHNQCQYVTIWEMICAKYRLQCPNETIAKLKAEKCE